MLDKDKIGTIITAFVLYVFGIRYLLVSIIRSIIYVRLGFIPSLIIACVFSLAVWLPVLKFNSMTDEKEDFDGSLAMATLLPVIIAFTIWCLLILFRLSFIPSLIIACINALAVWNLIMIGMSKSVKKRELRKTQTLQRFFQKVEKIAENYKNELALERSHLIYKDAYGNEQDDKWEKKGIAYFIDNVLLNKLSFDEKALYKEYSFKVQMMINDVARRAEIEIKSTSRFDESMSGVEFEKYCSDILSRNGWDVNNTKKTGDQGVDIIASQEGVEIAIQCKKSKNAVGNKAIQEIVAGARYYSIANSIVVTNSYYTKSAKNLAKINGVYLLHYNELKELFDTLTNSSDLEY